MSNQKKYLLKILPAAVCIGIGLLVGFLILIISNPSQALNGFRTILLGGFSGGARGVGNVFYYAVPVMMTGLGVAFSFKTGIFNIGGPGQFIMGGFVSVYAAINLNIEGPLRWIIPIILAAVAGAFWAGISGFLNAYFEVNIVISTIMLNYIGTFLVSELVQQYIFDISRNQSLPVPMVARLPRMGLDKFFPGSSINISFFIALLVVVVVYIILNKTTLGYELKATGLNKAASNFAGMNEKKNIMITMGISGALMGIGGALMYLADAGKCIPVSDILAVEGFNGIPVALLAMNNPIGVIFSALFIAYITVAGFYMQTYRFVPEIIDMIIAIIIYFSAFSLLIGQLIKRQTPAGVSNKLSFLKKSKKQKGVD